MTSLCLMCNSHRICSMDKIGWWLQRHTHVHWRHYNMACMTQGNQVRWTVRRYWGHIHFNLFLCNFCRNFTHWWSFSWTNFIWKNISNGEWSWTTDWLTGLTGITRWSITCYSTTVSMVIMIWSWKVCRGIFWTMVYAISRMWRGAYDTCCNRCHLEHSQSSSEEKS